MFDKQNFPCAPLFTRFGLSFAFVSPQYDFLSSQEVGSLTSSNLQQAAMVTSSKAGCRPGGGGPSSFQHCPAPTVDNTFSRAFPGTLLFVAEFQSLLLTERRSNNRKTVVSLSLDKGVSLLP